MKNNNHLIAAITGLGIGLLAAYWIPSPQAASRAAQPAVQVAAPNGVAGGAGLEVIDPRTLEAGIADAEPSALAEEFEAIYSSDQPGEAYRCQLVLAAWLAAAPDEALAAALAKHQAGATPDPLVALRAVGSPHWEKMVAFWDAGGEHHGRRFAALIGDLCATGSPAVAARMDLICALGVERGESLNKALEGAGDFATALGRLPGGDPLDPGVCSALGRLYAAEILAGGTDLSAVDQKVLPALLKAVIATAGQTSPMETLSFAAARDTEFNSGYYSLAIETALAADPAATEAWVFDQRDNRLLSYHGVSKVLSHFVAQGDAANCQRVFQEYHAQFPGHRLSAEAVAGAARLHPEFFIPVVEQMHPGAINREQMRDLTQQRPEAIEAMLATDQIAGRLEWDIVLAQQRFGDDYAGLLTELLDRGLGKEAVAVAAWDARDEDPLKMWEAVLSIDDAQAKGLAVSALVSGVHLISGDLAVSGVEELPAGAGRDAAMGALGSSFGKNDPRRGSELLHSWVEAGTLNDEFLSSYIMAASQSDWKGAFAWVREVQAPETRERLLNHFRKSNHVPDGEADRLLLADPIE